MWNSLISSFQAANTKATGYMQTTLETPKLNPPVLHTSDIQHNEGNHVTGYTHAAEYPHIIFFRR